MVLRSYTQQPEQEEKQGNNYLLARTAVFWDRLLLKTMKWKSARFLFVITAALGRLHWLNRARTLHLRPLRGLDSACAD